MTALAAMTAASALGCALLAACDSFDPAPATEPGTDAAVEATSTGDATVEPVLEASTGDAIADTGADASAPCTDDQPFAAPTELADLGDVTSVRLTHDGATAFVSFVVAAGNEDIDEGPFPKGNLLYAHTVSSPDLDSHPAPLTDPLRLFYEHGAPGSRVVVLGTREQAGQEFTLAAALPLVADDVEAREPYALGNGTVLYFTLQNGGARSIRRGTLAGGMWNVTAVAGISSGLPDGHPVVTDDELTIFFSRGAPADVWMATRTSNTAPFSAALPVGSLTNTTADDRPSWISPDRCTLLFTSNRSGGYRAYRASRR